MIALITVISCSLFYEFLRGGAA